MKKTIKVKVLSGTPFLISQEQQIGKGTFGHVVKAYKKDQPSQQLAAKIIPINQQNQQIIESEIKILKQIPHHQNLVNCIKIQVSTQHNFYLIMQYCNGGSFEKYIKNHQNCSQQIIWRFIKQFIKGYKILYDLHLIHRDIKPENILVHNGKIKIADFGFSRKIYHRNLMQNLSVKGTPLYIAPQLQCESQGNSKIDVFSFGVVIFRLAYNGTHPFYSNTQLFSTIDQYFNYLKKTQLIFPKYPKHSSQLQKLLKLMLQKDPNKRISWKQIFQHPLLQITIAKQPHNNTSHQHFNELRNSIIEIGKSAAHLQQISQPFNPQKQINAQIQRLIQFTSYLPSFQIRGLEIFVIRSKVIIQLIKYLNSILKPILKQKTIKAAPLLQKIYLQGYILCQHSISKIMEIIKKYQHEINNNENTHLNKLLCNLQHQKQVILSFIPVSSFKYQKLKYENLLYDYLTQFNDYKKQQKQQLKIMTALMIDLYDGLLKLQSMIIINEQEHIKIIDIELQDAQLDKIDYQNLKSYEIYLEEINQITLDKIQKNLKSMGLIIL